MNSSANINNFQTSISSNEPEIQKIVEDIEDNNNQDLTEILNISKVKEGFYIGDKMSAICIEVIIQFKITHILNTTGTQIMNNWESIGVKYLTLNWTENENQILFDNKDEISNKIVEFIDKGIEEGEGLLAHSFKGQNRVCIVVIIYLMKKYRWSLNKSMEYLKSKKKDVDITPYFYKQLSNLEKRLLKRNEINIKDIPWEFSNLKNPEEKLLRNTYMNGLQQPISVAFNEDNYKSNKKHIRWKDEINNEKIEIIDLKNDLLLKTNIKEVISHKNVFPKKTCIKVSQFYLNNCILNSNNILTNNKSNIINAIKSNEDKKENVNNNFINYNNNINRNNFFNVSSNKKVNYNNNISDNKHIVQSKQIVPEKQSKAPKDFIDYKNIINNKKIIFGLNCNENNNILNDNKYIEHKFKNKNKLQMNLPTTFDTPNYRKYGKSSDGKKFINDYSNINNQMMNYNNINLINNNKKLKDNNNAYNLDFQIEKKISKDALYYSNKIGKILSNNINNYYIINEPEKNNNKINKINQNKNDQLGMINNNDNNIMNNNNMNNNINNIIIHNINNNINIINNKKQTDSNKILKANNFKQIVQSFGINNNFNSSELINQSNIRPSSAKKNISYINILNNMKIMDSNNDSGSENENSILFNKRLHKSRMVNKSNNDIFEYRKNNINDLSNIKKKTSIQFYKTNNNSQKKKMNNSSINFYNNSSNYLRNANNLNNKNLPNNLLNYSSKDLYKNPQNKDYMNNQFLIGNFNSQNRKSEPLNELNDSINNKYNLASNNRKNYKNYYSEIMNEPLNNFNPSLIKKRIIPHTSSNNEIYKNKFNIPIKIQNNNFVPSNINKKPITPDLHHNGSAGILLNNKQRNTYTNSIYNYYNLRNNENIIKNNFERRLNTPNILPNSNLLNISNNAGHNPNTYKVNYNNRPSTAPHKDKRNRNINQYNNNAMRDNNYNAGKGEITNNNNIELLIQRPISSRRKKNNSFNNINNIVKISNNYKHLNMNNNITKEFSGHAYKKRLSSPPIYSGILNNNNYRKNYPKLDFNYIDNFQATNLYIKNNENIPNKMILNEKAIYNEFNYLNE